MTVHFGFIPTKDDDFHYAAVIIVLQYYIAIQSDKKRQCVRLVPSAKMATKAVCFEKGS